MLLFRSGKLLYQLRHRLLSIAKGELQYRLNWLRILSTVPTDTRIGWQARLSGSNVSLGRGCQIENFTEICSGSKDFEYIKIGSYSRVSSGAQIHSWGGFVEIGDYCSINANSILYGTGGITIGDYVRIAANTVIVASMHKFDSVDLPIMRQGYTARGIHIENDVWIGTGVCILDDVTIGEGAVIAAGAVVNGNVEPYSVVAGVPARMIKHRLYTYTDVGNLD
jgi:acetyltransferase-like isoleucine patch superfamily enzyme